MARKPKTVTLQALRPSQGLEVEYRRRLKKLIKEMNDSVTYWVEAGYRKNTPVIAQDKRMVPSMAFDEMPANILIEAIRKLSRRWLKAFDTAAEQMAEFFAKDARKRTDDQMKRIMKKGGFTVEFKMTRAMRDVLNATIGANVSLIKSIPEQYLKNVEGAVLRSVQAGRDLGSLAKELKKNYGVTDRRAAFIARSQNNLASAAMERARQIELGIDTAIWVHSGGGEPRPSHLKAGRERTVFSVSEGWPDPALGGKRIWPGTEPNCKCVSRAVVKGFT